MNYADSARFTWVDIWLNILLPLNNPQKTVIEEKDAQQLLKELRISSEEARTQLQSAYKRLWEFNKHRGLEDYREKLFRLALCSFEPLSPRALTEALRVRIDDDDAVSNNESLEVKDVKALYYNFLVEDDSGFLGFTHNSAKDFVSTMAAKKDSQNNETKLFSDRDNHQYAASLFIQVMKLPDHPLWGRAKQDPASWGSYLRKRYQTVSLSYATFCLQPLETKS